MNVCELTDKTEAGLVMLRHERRHKFYLIV